METVLLRFSWLCATKNLTDAQYREFINKLAVYGFSECTEDVYSDDAIVNAMLDVVKPSLRENVLKYINFKK